MGTTVIFLPAIFSDLNRPVPAFNAVAFQGQVFGRLIGQQGAYFLGQLTKVFRASSRPGASGRACDGSAGGEFLQQTWEYSRSGQTESATSIRQRQASAGTAAARQADIKTRCATSQSPGQHLLTSRGWLNFGCADKKSHLHAGGQGLRRFAALLRRSRPHVGNRRHGSILKGNHSQASGWLSNARNNWLFSAWPDL